MPQSNEETGFFTQLFNSVLNLCCGCCLTEDDSDQQNDFRRTDGVNNTQIISRELLPSRASLPSRSSFHQEPLNRSQQRSTQAAEATLKSQTSNRSTHADQVRRHDQPFRQTRFPTLRVSYQNNLSRARTHRPSELTSRVSSSSSSSKNKKRLDQNYFANKEPISFIPQIQAQDEYDQAFKNTNAVTTEVDENDSFGANRLTEPNTNRQGDLLREEAQKHFHKFKIFQKKAQLADKTDDKILSKRYFALANREKRLFEKANAAAAAAFLEENSLQSANLNIIDLHSLYVKEAIAALDIFIDSHIRTLRTQNKKSVFLTVITGRGKHSEHGPKIKPAVIKRFIERELKYVFRFYFSINNKTHYFRYTLTNPGRLKVLVFNNTSFS